MTTPGNWTAFRSFLPGSNLTGKEDTHFLWQVSNNTQGLLAEANLKVLRQRFAPWLATGEVTESTVGAGLRGVHIHAFLVPVCGHPAQAVMEEALRQLADYPILDEDVFSELEEDARFENVRDELRFQGFESDPETVDRVMEALTDSDYGDSSSGPYPDEGTLKAAALSLGLETA